MNTDQTIEDLRENLLDLIAGLESRTQACDALRTPITQGKAQAYRHAAEMLRNAMQP